MIDDIEVDLTSLTIWEDVISFGRYERENGDYVEIKVWRDKPDTEGNREISTAIYSQDKNGNETGMPMNEYIKYSRLAYKHAETAKEIWSMES